MTLLNRLRYHRSVEAQIIKHLLESSRTETTYKVGKYYLRLNGYGYRLSIHSPSNDRHLICYFYPISMHKYKTDVPLYVKYVLLLLSTDQILHLKSKFGSCMRVNMTTLRRKT